MKKNPYSKVPSRFWQRFAVLAALALGVGSTWAGTVTTTFTSSGTWTCPAGVTSISVAVQGGGGGGGGGGSTSGWRGGGGGGGACAYSSAVTVVPGTQYTVTVGAGGTAGAATSGTGGTGGTSSFSGGVITTLTATGGAGGALGQTGPSAQASYGTASGGSTANYNGGYGAPAKSTANGGGGGGAGTTSAGGNTSTSSGGAAGTGSPAGGAGADLPSTANNPGNPGNAPGGGGSGAWRTGNPQIGGIGARGQVTLTYSAPEKADNTTGLSSAGSWSGGLPGSSGLAVFDSVLATAGNASGLSLGADMALGNIVFLNPGGAVTVASGNTLTLNGGIDMSTATTNFTLNCALALGADSTWNVASGRTLTLGGTVSGAHNVTKQGSGKVALSGNNSSGNGGYSGTTTVNGGALVLNSLNAIANSSSVSVASGAAIAASVAGGTYGNTATVTLVGTGSSAGLAANSGALWFGQGGSWTTTWQAPLSLGGATTISAYGNTMNQTLSGGISGTGPLTIASQGGATDLHVWTLGTTASTYSGNTVINNNNGLNDITVQLGVDNALPTTTSLNLTGTTTTAAANTTLDLNGHPQTLAGLTDTGGSVTGGGTSFGKRVINSSGTPATLTIANSGADTYGTTGTRVVAGTIGGVTAAGTAANNLALVMAGTGTLTLGGANTYTGNTTISAGTLALSSSGSLASSSSINIAAGATFDVSAQTTYTLGSSATLTASGTASAATIKGGTTVSFGSQGVSLNYDGSDAALTVSQGTLSLSGNTFTIVTGSALSAGTYTLVSTPNNISGTVNGTPSYSGGSGVASGYTGTVSISGHNVILTVAASTYPVTFDPQGGSVSPTTSTITYSSTYGAGTAFPTPTRPGYTFNGWFTAINGGGSQVLNSTAVTTSPATTLYASWTINNYTLTYNAGSGGTISGSASQTIAYLGSGTEVTAVASNGFAFTAWSDGVTTANRTDTALVGGTNVTANFASLCSAPAIVGGISPGSLTATVGDLVVLTVTNITGAAPLSYQWLSNSVVIATATNSSYTNLSVTVADAGNYQLLVTNDCGSVTSSVAILTVNPQTPVIASLPAADSLVYGQALSASALTGGSVTNAAGSAIPGTFAYTTPSSKPAAGTPSEDVTFIPSDKNNYNNVSLSVSVPVSQANLSITANGYSKTYNGTGYTGGNGVSYSGFVNSEDASVLGGTLSYGGTSQGATNAGTYSIVPSGLTSANYNITFQNGTLTVSPLAVTVTADAQTKVYGTTDPALTYSVSPSLVAGDSFSGSLSRASGETVGNYAIGQGSLGLSANYSLTYHGTNLSITPASLTVTANSTGKAYGQSVTFAGTEFTTSTLVSGDSVTGATLASDGTTNTAIVGSYPITISGATGSGLGNYNISYVSGSLTVSPALLGVTADNQSRVYGATNPVFTATLSGYVNGEDASVVNGRPSLSSTADTNSPVGAYAITAAIGTLSATNYTFATTNGTLTVNPLAVTVTADAQAKVYGTPDPSLTYSASPSLVAGDSFTGSLSRASGANVGIYAITQGTLALSTNYSLSYNGANLTITPASLTVTANSQSKYYGQTVMFAGAEFTTSTLINGDSVSAVTLTSAGAVNTAAVGAYSIVPSAATGTGLGNYNVSYVTGTLTVLAQGTNVVTAVIPGFPLTVTAAGIPGYTYVAQRTTDLTSGTWVSVSTNTAAGDGTIISTDSFVDLGGAAPPQAFYRFIWQP